MKTFIDSLSLGSGAALIAVVSGLLAWPLGYVRKSGVRWGSALILPGILSYCLYWSPVWLGANSSGYFSWAPLFVGAWSLAGVVSSGTVIFIMGRCRAKPASK
ncbi:MAG TPA: hypothetical protein VGO57_04445 [Verrucomicrobiae bacterium]|jgi:hypothetical protein